MAEQFVIRVLTLGYTDVGKSSILLRFTKNQFHEKYVSTIGVDFKSKPIKISENITVKIIVWDTAGQEKYKGIVKSFYNKANGILLTYDICNKDSFERIDYWVQQLKEYTGIDDLYIVLVGNKKDRDNERKVSYEDAKNYAEDNHFGGYFEVSAKSGEGIYDLFSNVAKGAVKKMLMKNGEEDLEGNIRLSTLDKAEYRPNKRSCCWFWSLKMNENIFIDIVLLFVKMTKQKT